MASPWCGLPPGMRSAAYPAFRVSGKRGNGGTEICSRFLRRVDPASGENYEVAVSSMSFWPNGYP